MIFTQPEIEERWALNFDYYWKPYTHIGPFCVGLALGYYMATNKMHSLSYRARMTGWALSLLTLFLVLFGSYGWTMGLETHPIINALHHSTHRTVWSIGLAWIIYACVTGQGGWINGFLSWKGFVPMSRLSFMVYLVHPWLIWIYMANLRQMIDTSHYTGV
jgi:peptidoglycan/LPS O-acetylase OafA/YrhL